MVVFEDGLPKKADYRRFAVRGDEGGVDDTRAMREVLSRRFRRMRSEQDGEPGARRRDHRDADGVEVETSGRSAARCWPASTPRPAAPAASPTPPTSSSSTAAGPRSRPPRALADVGVVDVALCGLAKRLEEVWLPGEEHPVVLPRTSQGLFLLQRVRDEAHRFAITYHRSKRSKAMTTSALDGVPGLGQARKTALLRHFGSVKKLRAATAEEVAAVPGMGAKTAAAVVEALAGSSAAAEPAVNTATGELLD